MGRVERTREIFRRRTRRTKLKKLRAQYAKAGSTSEKQEILSKAQKISPFVQFDAKSD